MRASVATLTFLVCHQTSLFPLVDAKSKVSIQTWNISHTSPKYLNIIKHSVSHDSVLNIDMELLKDLTSLYASVEVFSNKNGIKKTIVKTHEYDLCRLLSNMKRKDISIIHMIFQQLLKSVKLPVNSCPIRKGRISFKNFHLDGSNIPSVIPSGLYYILYNTLTTDEGGKILIVSEEFDIRIERI